MRIRVEQDDSGDTLDMPMEFVVTSEDPALNRGLITALMGADKLSQAYSSGSVFERIYFTTTEAVAVIKEGCHTEARHRVEKATRSKIPCAKDVGLKIFLREAPTDDGKKDTPIPGF